ncbi:hypothetical protein NFI96_016108 [Prochilodus magdalenae]|nr:hypothetical protein NFI96_016108 [Prochilodus magdalenae]
MSEPRFREWILDTIDSLRSRKARPDLERICRMVRRRHGSEPDRTCVELEKLIQEHAVLKVNYKGSVSYRNAAKVQRGRRKLEQASAVKPAAKRACTAEVNHEGGGDNALGPADEEPMEDGEVRESSRSGKGGGARRWWGVLEDVREPDSKSGRRLLKKGAVLMLFEWNNFPVPLSRPGVWERRKRPTEDDTPVKEADTIPGDHNYASAPDPAAVDLVLEENTLLGEEILQLKQQIEKLTLEHQFGIHRFAGSDSDIRFYTKIEQVDFSDELSTTAGLDSSMDEEEASLDAPCMQNTTDSGISLSPITDAGASQPARSPSALKSSPSHSSLEPESETAHAPTEHTQPAAQQDAGSPELELARQPAAICPSAQRTALTGEEGPRAEENALTPDQLLSDCRASLHQGEAVSSDREPVKGSVPTEEGKKCSKGDEVACTHEIEQAKNGGMKRGGSVKTEEIAQDPLQWSVADVVSYFTAVGFPEQAVAFRTQEIDGKSLLLMQRSDVLTGLSIRLGPALKIYEHHVKVLQRSHFQDDGDVIS